MSSGPSFARASALQYLISQTRHIAGELSAARKKRPSGPANSQSLPTPLSALSTADADVHANRGVASALYAVVAHGVWVPVPRWSRTMATACCWVSLEPAENA